MEGIRRGRFPGRQDFRGWISSGWGDVFEIKRKKGGFVTMGGWESYFSFDAGQVVLLTVGRRPVVF